MIINTSSKPEFNAAEDPTDRRKVDVLKHNGDQLMHTIQEKVAPGARRSVALRHLETAMMYAVKAVHYPGE